MNVNAESFSLSVRLRKTLLSLIEVITKWDEGMAVSFFLVLRWGLSEEGGLGDSYVGHVGSAESHGQLQVLLLLEPKPPQPLLFLPLALPLGPLQLLTLTSKHREVQAGSVHFSLMGSQDCLTSLTSD